MGQIGKKAKAAVDPLTGALKDPDKGVQRAAGIALKRIDPEAAMRAGVK